MRRYFPALVGLAVLFATGPAHAQVGGIVKKAVPKVPGQEPASAAPAKPKCDASQAVITSDVVARYQKSLAAGNAEVEKMTKEGGSTGAYYSALARQRAARKRQDDFRNHVGPDWDKQQAITKRLTTGDTTAIKEQMALDASLREEVKLPDLSWDDQQKNSARINDAMRNGGGFDQCDWTDLSEKIPRVVGILADDPNAKDFQGFATAKEAAAVKPKLAELAPALGIAYVTPEEQARRKKQAQADSAAAAEPASSGDATTDCMVKTQNTWAKAHQAELDAASKSKDMNAILQLNAELQTEMNKCNSGQ